MNNVHEFPGSQSKSSQEAAEWVARLGNGLNSEQEAVFAEWLNKNEQNHREFSELAKLWDSMDALSRLARMFPESEIKRVKTSSGRGWLIAASVFLAAGIASWFAMSSLPGADEHVAAVDSTTELILRTEIGEQSNHTLADGTFIVLNTDSEVAIDFTESNRLLRLERGEIHLKVAHDPTRPLGVIIGDKVVQAVGTEFNLEISSDQSIELVVTDGLVMVGIVRPDVDDNESAGPLVLDQNFAMVAAGQEVTIEADERDIDTIEAEDIESENISVKLSWREGNLIFRGESLEEAVEEVGRYTAVEFVFLDEAAKKVRVAGLYKAGDVEGLLAALRAHFNISYEWQGDDRIILSAE